MADASIDVEINLEDGSIVSDGKKAGDKAGKAVGDGVESGAEKGAKSGGSKLDSEVGSAGKSAGDTVGAGIKDGIKQGAEAGASAAQSSLEGFASKAKGILAGISVGAGLAGVKELTDIANETQEDLGKLATAAGTNNVAWSDAHGTFVDMVGILGETDQSVEATNHLFQLCGNNTEQLGKWTKISQGIYATFGDSLPIEGLTEAANETAKVGQVTGPFADALNWATDAAVNQGIAMSGNQKAIDAYNAAISQGMSHEDAFNAALAACNNEQERTDLITQTMLGTYEAASDVYGDLNADVIEYRKNNALMNEALANLGEAFMPAISAATGFGANLIEGVIPYVQQLMDWLGQIGESAMPVLQDAFSGFGEFISPIIEWLIDAFGKIYDWVTNQLLPAIISFGEQVAPSVQELFDTAQNGWNMLQPIFQAVFDWLASNLPPIIEGLAPLVSAVIGTIVAAVQLVQAVWGVVWGFLEPILNAIVGFFSAAIPIAVSALTGAFDTISGVIGVITGVFNTISSFVGGVVGFFTGNMPGAINGMLGFFGNIPGAISGVFSNALGAVSGFISAFGTVGHNIVVGIWNGIAGMANWLWNQCSNFAGNILKSVKGALGIHSPSRKFRDVIGRNIARGIVVGYELENPMDIIEGSVNSSMRAMDVQGAGISAISNQDVKQVINFNVPTATPDVVAREMRMYSHYGLAGSV